MTDGVKGLPAEAQGSDQTANLLTNLAQILDVVKIEWGEAWSEWDQAQRDGITKYLLAREVSARSPAPTRT